MSLKKQVCRKNKEKRKRSRASVRWHSVAPTIIAAGRSSRTLWFIYFSIIDSTVNSFLCVWRAPHQLSSFFLPISSSRLHSQWPNASDAQGKSTPLIMSVLRAAASQYRQMSSLWKNVAVLVDKENKKPQNSSSAGRWSINTPGPATGLLASNEETCWHTHTKADVL